MLDKKTVRRHFERAADTYDAAAVLQKEVARRLLERLDYIKIQPKRVLDIGSGTGFVTADVLKRYPKAQVLSLDIAHSMAKKSQQCGRWLRKSNAICADAEQLPIKNDSIDLILSSLMLQWSNDLAGTFQGFHATLAPNGLLLFASFGPDTLKEIRQSWASVDHLPHTSDFADMHEIGDSLLQAGFIDPVTDMEMITMTYANVRQLMRDIKQIGASNSQSERQKGLMGKQKLKAFEQAYQQFKTADGLYPASWEIIYGHAWVAEGIAPKNFKGIPITV
jgi:malonyl-CoA O-methyltransferase